MTAPDARLRGQQAIERRAEFDARIAAIDARDGFDARFGVETSAPVEQWELKEADQSTLGLHNRYSPTPLRTVRAAIGAALAGCDERPSFVDFGCGKGRVLLVASEFSFARILGVEFSATLCGVARRNIIRYWSTTQQCRALEVCCQDAAQFVIPDDAGVLYFYEPFGSRTAAKVFENIESSLRAHPRRAVVCLVGKGLSQAIGQRPCWRQIGSISSPDDEYYDTTLYAIT